MAKKIHVQATINGQPFAGGTARLSGNAGTVTVGP